MHIAHVASCMCCELNVLRIAYIGDSTQPQQKSAGAGENCDFVIAVNFHPVKKLCEYYLVL